MPSEELRKKFLDFFKSRGHTVVPSSSLIPDDPSVLLTTAGMQQFKPYFLGKADPAKDFGSKRVASIQKAFRTSDIDEVGDESHLTFFEMLGHFSFGDYFKKETIEWTYEFLTEVLKIPKERISATVFAGDDKIPFDTESYDAWSKFLPAEKIKKGSRADNVWGPAGPEGPCGAANEVYVDDLEVATLVFMEYYCTKDGSLTSLPQKGVDVGWGFERLAMIVQNKKNIFETDLFAPIMKILPSEVEFHHRRIIADHLRGSIFLFSDGVRPSNKDQGYVLRRLMRRIFLYEHWYKIPSHVFDALTHDIIHEYGTFYAELMSKNNAILEEFTDERGKFSKTLERGLQEFGIRVLSDGKKVLSGKDAFDLYQTFGFPKEIMRDLCKHSGTKFDEKGYDHAQVEHKEISRAGQEKKFGGHGLLLDTGELKAADEEELKKVTRLHTATHLLQAALRKIFGDGVKQAGSDITAERTRFDFSFDRKLTGEEIKKVEDLVNEVIAKKLPVSFKEFPIEEAQKTGALFFFKEKYPEKVRVYYAGDSLDSAFSKEFCGGPHVKNTSEIGRFKILKQEAVGAGLRRIRATVE